MTQRYIITDGIKQKYAKKDRLKRKETEYVAVTGLNYIYCSA